LQGEFALSNFGETRAGRETLRVDVELSQIAPPTDTNGKPQEIRLGCDEVEPPPCRPHFTLADGRHFAARVSVVSAR
jgi:hypothetical protein